MTLETNRLLLRPWQESDAAALYRYASDPAVGPIAGWPVHTSVENSLEIIRSVLSAPETYAVVLKETNEAVGSIGLKLQGSSGLVSSLDEAELGYWIGVPYWGQGLIPEAAELLLCYGFETLGLTKIWCACYAGNEKSRRVQEKCGFTLVSTQENISCPLLGEVRTEVVSALTRDQWRTNQNRK